MLPLPTQSPPILVLNATWVCLCLSEGAAGEPEDPGSQCYLRLIEATGYVRQPEILTISVLNATWEYLGLLGTTLGYGEQEETLRILFLNTNWGYTLGYLLPLATGILPILVLNATWALGAV